MLGRRRVQVSALYSRDLVVLSTDGTKGLRSSLQTERSAAYSPHAKCLCIGFSLVRDQPRCPFSLREIPGHVHMTQKISVAIAVVNAMRVIFVVIFVI